MKITLFGCTKASISISNCKKRGVIDIMLAKSKRIGRITNVLEIKRGILLMQQDNVISGSGNHIIAINLTDSAIYQLLPFYQQSTGYMSSMQQILYTNRAQ